MNATAFHIIIVANLLPKKMKNRLAFYCFLVFMAIQLTAYGQENTDWEKLKVHVSDYTIRLASSVVASMRINSDTINTFSYLVVYDDASELDTIIISPLLDSLTIQDEGIEILRKSYATMGIAGLELTNTAIFVPVMIMQADASYNVTLDTNRLLRVRHHWRNLFSILTPKAIRHKLYTIPINVFLTKPSRINSAIPKR